MTIKKKKLTSSKKIRHEIARKHYLDPTSPGFLNEKKSLIIAGYSENTADSNSGRLWEDADVKEILPDNVKNAREEMKKWLSLMANWRDRLAEVEDPIKLGSKTFAVVSSYIERLAKIFGMMVERVDKRELRVNVDWDFRTGKTLEEQLERLKFMQKLEEKEIKKLEAELNIASDGKYHKELDMVSKKEM